MNYVTKTTIITLSAVALLVMGGLYFLHLLWYSFLSALAPPDVTVTKNFILTNRDFINGVTIEKIRVDSMGDNGYPIAYTVIYTTSCGIHHPDKKPPNPPDKIEFNKPGKYSWNEDTVKKRYEHRGLSRIALDTSSKGWWANKFGEHSICPLKFEQQHWYFITIGDPQVTGIFFYIDSAGREYQYFLPSGISPI